MSFEKNKPILPPFHRWLVFPATSPWTSQQNRSRIQQGSLLGTLARNGRKVICTKTTTSCSSSGVNSKFTAWSGITNPCTPRCVFHYVTTFESSQRLIFATAPWHWTSRCRRRQMRWMLLAVPRIPHTWDKSGWFRMMMLCSVLCHPQFCVSHLWTFSVWPIMSYQVLSNYICKLANTVGSWSMLIIYNTDSIYCIPNILSFYYHNILSYNIYKSYIYIHIICLIVSISPRVGEHFLGDHPEAIRTRPGSLSFHGPHDVEAAALEALGKSMGNRPVLPPWHWVFLQIFGRIQGIAQLAHCKMVGQKVCTRSSSTKLQQVAGNSTTVFQKTPGVHSTL
jgi:hypothetical protein